MLRANGASGYASIISTLRADVDHEHADVGDVDGAQERHPNILNTR